MKSQKQRGIGLETEVIDGVPVQVGRDPRNMSQNELRDLGHSPLSILQAIRARCIDCCAGSPSEVRRCVSINCPSWPFRMAFNPWRERPDLSDERKTQMSENLAKARAAKAAFRAL
jgi:hypothetical protein